MPSTVFVISFVTSSAVGVPSAERDRWFLVFFRRNCVSAMVGIPWASSLTEGRRLLGSSNLVCSWSVIALRAGLDLGQSQICWFVSVSLKHLEQVVMS